MTDCSSFAKASVERHAEDGLDVVCAKHGAMTETILTLRPKAGEGPAAALERFARVLQGIPGDWIKIDGFGGRRAHAVAEAAFRRAGAAPPEPMAWILSDDPDPGAFAGMQAVVVAGAPVRAVEWNGRAIGRAFDDEAAALVWLNDIRPADPKASRAAQARQAIAGLRDSLAAAGFQMSDLVRTWYYNERILEWYGDFNRERTAIYGAQGAVLRIVPASTGIGGANPAGAALQIGAVAAKPLSPAFSLREAASPLQCPAPNYGSSFSRAVEMKTGSLRRLFVSGTASIDPEGRTAHRGDTLKQIDLTFRVVEAILEAAGMDFSHASRAIAYFREAKDAALYARSETVRSRPALPVVIAVNEVCRGDLLFELELDAIAAV